MDKKELVATLMEVLSAPEKKDISYEDVRMWLHEKATHEDVQRLLQEDDLSMQQVLGNYYLERVHDDEAYLNVSNATVDEIYNVIDDADKQSLLERLWDDLPTSDRREFVLSYLENTL